MKPKPIRVEPSWLAFSVEKAERSKAAAGWLVENFVNGSLPAPATDYDLVSFICSTAFKPIPLVSVSEQLREKGLIRGTVCSAMPGDLLDEIAMGHEGLEWWVTAEGLHMEAVVPRSAVPLLSAFDQFAGPQIVANWRTDLTRKNTRLSESALQVITVALDVQKFKPLDVLQPAQKRALSAHNAMMSRKGIKTFEDLSKHPKFIRGLRKHLAETRARYLKALSTEMDPPHHPIPQIFYCTNPLLV